jgi:ribosomal protein S18 acetylase RimI-like enzyme
VSPVFRTATAGDVQELVELVESAYRGDASRAGWTTEADLLGGQRTDREEVQALVAEPAVILRLAFGPGDGSSGAGASKASDRDGLLGCVLVRSEGAHAHVGMFAVRPTLQSRGLGRALLAEAERIARERGAIRAKMTVIEQRSELLAWYARRGYRSTGETEPFPYGNPRFGLPKREDLRFLVLEKELAPSRRGP